MSQLGMQMPGGGRRRGSSPDVYTALVGLAVITLGAACFVVYLAAAKIGKDGSPFGLQDAGKIQLPASK